MATPGPAFSAAMENVTFWPMVGVALSTVTDICTSAVVTGVTVAVAVSLVALGSVGVDAVLVAVSL